MLTIVRRYSFFEGDTGGSIRFTETSPPTGADPFDHPLCNCTRHVTERPPGQPTQVSQSIRFEWTIGVRTVCVDAQNDTLHFTMRWPPEQGVPTDPQWSSLNRPHAYFWFSEFDKLTVEITKAGEGIVDCFFGKLFLGDKVDTSSFRNGHSPSHVVKQSLLGPDALWCYGGHWYTEMMSIFDTPEADQWRRLWRTVGAVQQSLQALNRIDQSVDAVRQAVEDGNYAGAVEASAIWLSGVIDRLEETELYSRCRAVTRRE